MKAYILVFLYKKQALLKEEKGETRYHLCGVTKQDGNIC